MAGCTPCVLTVCQALLEALDMSLDSHPCPKCCILNPISVMRKPRQREDAQPGLNASLTVCLRRGVHPGCPAPGHRSGSPPPAAARLSALPGRVVARGAAGSTGPARELPFPTPPWCTLTLPQSPSRPAGVQHGRSPRPPERARSAPRLRAHGSPRSSRLPPGVTGLPPASGTPPLPGQRLWCMQGLGDMPRGLGSRHPRGGRRPRRRDTCEWAGRGASGSAPHRAPPLLQVCAENQVHARRGRCRRLPAPQR